jgi:flagellar protein FliO/FliZ
LFVWEGNLKHLIIIFIAALLCGVQSQGSAQTFDGPEGADASTNQAAGAPGAATSGDAGQGREAERGYLLGEGEAAAPQDRGGVSSVWAIFRIVIVLAVTAAAIYGVMYFLKRKKEGDLPDDTYLKVLARVPVNVKTAAAVIAVGGKAWLVGLSDTNVSVISEITDQETVDAMMLAYSGRAVHSNNAASFSFAGLLRRFAGGNGRPVRKPQDAADIPQPLNLQRNRDRLKNL